MGARLRQLLTGAGAGSPSGMARSASMSSTATCRRGNRDKPGAMIPDKSRYG